MGRNCHPSTAAMSFLVATYLLLIIIPDHIECLQMPSDVPEESIRPETPLELFTKDNALRPRAIVPEEAKRDRIPLPLQPSSDKEAIRSVSCIKYNEYTTRQLHERVIQVRQAITSTLY
ncbi:hypothetical protein CAPTEDRAFT_209304 [Capitella teleta]|uniref:Uncharacterized protein n=1 Tax=Capitella teleta TaxID=283909 RepID=R7UCH7_CAPTE|nr:hypothetical protein CAPTEDRAFT_209304 [Capitella teleta]|eukprot:ELU00942.1 hypothetical protein CAPTEDRAFT_209304 [Capitella teleta]